MPLNTKVQFYDLAEDGADPRAGLEQKIKDELSHSAEGWRVAAAFAVPGQKPDGQVVAVIYQK